MSLGKSSLTLHISLAALLFAVPAVAQTVHGWEATIAIPTYLLGPDDPNPPFPLVSGRDIYPYTMLDDLTDQRETKTYLALYLENEYLKATILPELGGRLYSLYDKHAHREVFYRNNVVKYGLVALRGAWISGGVEFNFPNGHTTDTVSRVAYRLLQSPDGAATAVVGDVDQVSGMHWEVALTLRAGEARLQQRVTLFNDTPLTQLYWYWANAAVPATQDMQFIYPMREANPHSHMEIWSFPVWNGTDYSWYKDVRQPTSLFARQVHRTFFGAYYHEGDDGVVHVADFRDMPGKKIWTWGTAGDGLIWNNLLSDKDGAYNEIQAGRFETQLSQEFISPQRGESWTEYWYPVQGLQGGFVEANADLAINARFLPPTGGAKPSVEVLAESTLAVTAKVTLKLGSKVLSETAGAQFQPGIAEKFTAEVDDLQAAKSQLDVEITAVNGTSMLHWFAGDPVDGNRDFVPAAGLHAIPEVPDAALTASDLFIMATNDEKEGRDLDALRRYEEILQRDPAFVPALLKMAERQYRAANFPTAESFIAKAIARDPENPHVHYLAGVIYRGNGRWGLAQDAFWASILYGGEEGPAIEPLIACALSQKQYAKAIDLQREHRGDALSHLDMIVALRLSGQKSNAFQASEAAAYNMPLHPFAQAEAWRNAAAGGPESAARSAETWKHAFGHSSQNYLEVGIWYRNLGDYESSDFFLKAAAADLAGPRVSPLIYYYLSSNARHQGETAAASAFAAQAVAAPYDYVFPNRVEDAGVLAEAISANPEDVHALYFLGNFLFAHGRYDEAAKNWSLALAQGFESAVLNRNLGLYAWKVKNDPSGAVDFFEKAIKRSPHDYRLYNELDEIYTQLNSSERREKMFAGAPADVLDRDALRVRRVLLLVEKQQFGQALDLLQGHNFKPWEGGQVVREMFVLANLEKGRLALAAKDYKASEQAFRRALEYPVNLGVGKPDKPQDAEPNFWLGEALNGEGDANGAHAAWLLAAQQGGGRGATLYYHALALERLGHATEAARLLAEITAGPSGGRTHAFDYYAAGLAEQHRSQGDQAKADFQQALKLDPALWRARIEVARKSSTP